MPLTQETERLLADIRAFNRPNALEIAISELRRYESLELRYIDEPEPVQSVTYDVISTAAGAVPVRLYRPTEPPPHPLIVYFHGGGWALGDIALYDGCARRLCRDTNHAVLSVDYHLAPEHPFPAPAEDCYAALAWVAARTDAEALDPGRIVVLGDSAGGIWPQPCL